MAEKANKRKSWSLNEKITLYVRCGGRCSLCGSDLLRHHLTGDEGVYGELAHIVAHEPGGPRGNGKVPYDERETIDNIIVLCHPCHKDMDDNPDKYPEEWLKEKKNTRERNAMMQQALPDTAARQAIVFTAPIAGKGIPVSEHDIRKALFDSNLFPGPSPSVNIELMDIYKENDSHFWSSAEKELSVRFARNMQGVSSKEGYAIFGIAPMPLLVKFGSLLTELPNTTIFNLFRAPERAWCWADQNSRKDDVSFELRRYQSPSSEIRPKALVLSLTSDIVERVKAYEKYDIWEIRASNIKYETIQTRQGLENFRLMILSVLDKMSKEEGDIHVFMAIPNSAAIMFGMCLKPKAHPNIILYDFLSSLNMDKEAITIPCL